jgi:hypothetical protein
MDCWAGATAWVNAQSRSASCSVLRTASCAGPAFAQTGRISRSHRRRHRTVALVAAVLPGSWASLPIAGRVSGDTKTDPPGDTKTDPPPGHLLRREYGGRKCSVRQGQRQPFFLASPEHDTRQRSHQQRRLLSQEESGSTPPRSSACDPSPRTTGRERFWNIARIDCGVFPFSGR